MDNESQTNNAKTMKEGTKRTIKRIVDIVITVLTALLTTLSAHAAIG